uniref:Uncharacterized protein n=1 Tax=Parascaris equorum TaxID=6256 RepID=A0A914SBN8_PAREQ
LCYAEIFSLAEFLRNISAERYIPIQNADTEEFGLAQRNGITCLLLKFSAKLYNLNLNDIRCYTIRMRMTVAPPINDERNLIQKFLKSKHKLYENDSYFPFFRSLQRSVRHSGEPTGVTYDVDFNDENRLQIPKISSPNVKINGYCALNDSKKNAAYLQIKWNTEDRKKSLKLYFVTANVKTLVKQLEELRWLMSNVTYIESFSGQSVEFSSSDVVISAPLKQKFVCGDKLNISLHSDRFKDYILELEPEIHAQPYNAAVDRANIYVCERTRRRTLAESFQNKMTIASGVVLGIASVSMLAGYSVRRQLNPSRQQLYQSLS